jgi:hypothetical protein
MGVANGTPSISWAPWSFQGLQFFWNFSAKFCSSSPAALPVITSTARTVNAQGPPALTAPAVAQPDSISVELHGRAAPANMVPELITVAVVSAVMPVMGH